MRIAAFCAYFQDGLVEHIAHELLSSGLDVGLHLWALESTRPGLEEWTRGSGLLPKFEALGRLFEMDGKSDLVLLIDDDVGLPRQFLSRFVQYVEALEVDLAQPALTLGSYFSHPITLQRPGCLARLTNFVESGPVVAMTREFFDLVTPFPSTTPMGWGIESHWRSIAERNCMRMGIVDACVVEHTHRRVGEKYCKEDAREQMQRFLSMNRLSWSTPRSLRCLSMLFTLGSSGSSHCVQSILQFVTGQRPETVISFGSHCTPLSKGLAAVLGNWSGSLITIHPGAVTESRSNTIAIAKTVEEAFASWSTPIQLALFDGTDRTGEQLERFLDTWVATWLVLDGQVILANVDTEVIRGWIEQQQAWELESRETWKWEEFGTNRRGGVLSKVDELSERVATIEAGFSDRGQTSAVPAPRSVEARPTVSLIVAAHNEGRNLLKTIECCIEISRGLNYEIIVADDASTDGSLHKLADSYPSLRVVRNAKRQGGPACKAMGGRAARGDVFVFLDAHCKPEPGAIERLVYDIDELAGRAIVTPRIPALDTATWTNGAGHFGDGYSVDLQTLEQSWLPAEQLRTQDRFYESPALIGCCMAVSRELYEKLRGFDADMLLWGTEDIDLGMKAWLMGHPVLVDTAAVIGHRFQTTFSYPVAVPEALANHLRFARKHFSEPVWHDWLERFQARHPHSWNEIWHAFESRRDSVEDERVFLRGNRVHDEFWYGLHFGLAWPTSLILGAAQTESTDVGSLADLADRRHPATIVGVEKDQDSLAIQLDLQRDVSGRVCVSHASVEGAGCEPLKRYAATIRTLVRGRALSDLRTLDTVGLLRHSGTISEWLASSERNGHDGEAHWRAATKVVDALKNALSHV